MACFKGDLAISVKGCKFEQEYIYRKSDLGLVISALLDILSITSTPEPVS